MKFKRRVEWMGHRNCACPQPQVTRESWSSFESASTMQCSWSKVLPGASQLLRQILTQPVNGGTRFEPAVREQLSLEIDGTMQKKHSTTWKKWSPRSKYSHIMIPFSYEGLLVIIPCGNWYRAIPRDEWWDWGTHCFSFQDTHKNCKYLSLCTPIVSR